MARTAPCPRHGGEHPLDDHTSSMNWGEPICPKCGLEASIGRLKRDSGIPPRFVNAGFDNYVAESADQRSALAAVRAYAEGFDVLRKAGVSLILLGRPGTGKTHLAIAAGHALIQRAIGVRYTTAADMLRAIRETWDRKYPPMRDVGRYGVQKLEPITEADRIREYISPDLLVLDEVGVQTGTDNERALLYAVLGGRYDRIKPTLVVSNEGIDGLNRYLGERVMDRLRDGGGKISVFDWPSWRGRAPATRPSPNLDIGEPT